MYTKARIAGHPIHPMLVAFPVALYVATVVTLFVHIVTGDSFWFRAALWANIGGVATAVLAAIPGFVDLINLPRHSRAQRTGLRHAAFNVLALGLFAISAVMLYRTAGGTAMIPGGAYRFDVTAPFVLSILGALSTVAAGWLGWTLVQTHHVGIAPSPFARTDLDAEELEEFEPREARMPATYRETYRTTIRH